MKRHRRRLGAYDPVEEASLRRLQTIGFPVEVTLKKHQGRKILVCIPVKHCMFVPTNRLFNTRASPNGPTDSG